VAIYRQSGKSKKGQFMSPESMKHAVQKVLVVTMINVTEAAKNTSEH
jgi:3-deoxy-D-manno-octulosonic acid (KDO) 8-phosphate synthase